MLNKVYIFTVGDTILTVNYKGNIVPFITTNFKDACKYYVRAEALAKSKELPLKVLEFDGAKDITEKTRRAAINDTVCGVEMGVELKDKKKVK